MKKSRKWLGHAAFAAVVMSNVTMVGMAAQGTLRAYYANDPAGRNVVHIMSDAPLETMLTTTNKITADIQINTNNVLDNPRARFEVDTASLDTGIDLRNEHMRGAQWLDTAKFPKATFVLTRVLSPTGRVPLEQGKTMNGEVEGDFTFHGVTKPVRAKLQIRTLGETEATKQRLPGDLMHIRATFPLKLDDFGVNVAAPAQAKIANVQQVTVDVYSSTGSPAPGAAPAGTENAATRPAANTNAAQPTGARKMENGLQIEDLVVGTGEEAKAGQRVTVHYRGTLTDGKEFDASYNRNQPFTFSLGAGEVIKGWDQGVAGMKVGGKRRLTIPSELGYGTRGAGGVIPPNATLMFDVELLKVN
jgi:FKBP-type peptidyl-prolyl cis-trans isomerase